jgi:hypothetical protein
MKKLNRVRRNGSPSAAIPQPQTAPIRASARPSSAAPGIVLLPGDGGVGSDIVRFSRAEYAALKTAFGGDPRILQYMVNEAVEEACRRGVRVAGDSSPVQEIKAPSPTESEEEKALTYAILTVPLAETGKLPPKADDAVVALAAKMGCKAELGEVHRLVHRLASAPSPLIRLHEAGWRLTAAGQKEHMELMMWDCSRRRKALESRNFKARCELEDAVYQAIGCIHLLGCKLGQIIIEEDDNLQNSTAAGIYHISEATSDRLKSALAAALSSAPEQEAA